MEEKKDYIIELENVFKKFDDSETYVVEDFNLKIKKGEFVTFLGPSGCGKTTTLRMIAGFDTPTSGKILLNGKDIAHLPPYKRPINTVFQRYALFAHLNVFDNIAFGLNIKKVPYTYKDKNGEEKTKMVHLSKDTIVKKVQKALALVDLEGFENRDIATLSGGQQQRIAIARAIVNEPEILLLDEPLGALDLKMRKEMQLELKEMHKKLGITFIYVTHDQEEALTMSDKIVVMREGDIEQVGTADEIYNDPVNRYVANFIGDSNLFPGVVIDRTHVKLFDKIFGCDETRILADTEVDLLLRPEDLDIVAPEKGKLHGRVDSIFFKGVFYEVDVMLENTNRTVTIHTTDYIHVDKYVVISFEDEDIHVMERE